jgi:hypothetical protein
LRLRRTTQRLVLGVFDPVSGRISTAEIETGPPGKGVDNEAKRNAGP